MDLTELRRIFATLSAKEFSDVVSLVNVIESIENLFLGFIEGNNSRDHKFVFVSPEIERITGYPSERFMKEDGTAFFYSKTPEAYLPHIFERVAFYNNETQVPGFDTTQPQFIQIDAGLIHAHGHLIKMRCSSVVLEYTMTNEIFLLMSTWQDTTHISYERLESIDELLRGIFTQLKTLYVCAYPEKFLMSENRQRDLTKIIYPLYKGPIATKTEMKILQLIADGLSSKEISGRLNISFHTAEAHRKNLLQKFDAKNSAELIKKASKVYWLE